MFIFFRDLMLTLMQNRGCDFTDVLNNEDIAMETANTIGQDLKAALVLNKPIPPMPLPAFDNLQYLPQMLPYLTFEQLFDHVDLYLTSPEHRAKLLQMRELVEEDQRVQTCILLHLLSAFQREYLSTTEKILRPVGASKWAFEDLESEVRFKNTVSSLRS